MRHALLPFVLAAGAPLAAQPLVGTAEALDGDSLVIDSQAVRLAGIDAPEIDQSCAKDGVAWNCGQIAKSQLDDFLKDKEVWCEPAGEEAGRTVAICHAGGVNLNAAMVEYGWATAYRQYNQAYLAQETIAKSQRRGIWSSDFAVPEHFRNAQRAAAMPEPYLRQASRPSTSLADVDVGCTIKGNRSWRGEWIYHLPGMEYYAVTRAEEIFCSEAAARAAGYRRAKA